MANTRYENFVLENELKDQLNTRLNMLDYLTPCLLYTSRGWNG